jgi:hypothetical protein
MILTSALRILVLSQLLHQTGPLLLWAHLRRRYLYWMPTFAMTGAICLSWRLTLDSDWSESEADGDEVPAMIAEFCALRGDQPMLRYGHIADDDPLANYHHVDVGLDDEQEVEKAIHGLLDTTKRTNVLSEEGYGRLEETVWKHKSVWVLKLGIIRRLKYSR